MKTKPTILIALLASQGLATALDTSTDPVTDESGPSSEPLPVEGRFFEVEKDRDQHAPWGRQTADHWETAIAITKFHAVSRNGRKKGRPPTED